LRGASPRQGSVVEVVEVEDVGVEVVGVEVVGVEVDVVGATPESMWNATWLLAAYGCVPGHAAEAPYG
jgi:hypothetical protein